MSPIEFKGCAPHNFRKGRPAGLTVEAVVIHIIDGPQRAADSTFLDDTLPNPRSAHYSVGRDGTVHQYVDEADTAYHAGNIVNPSWSKIKKTSAGVYVNPNYYTIGIEHDGRANDEWTDAMYIASTGLLRAISGRYPALRTLTRDNVVMHRQIRADKTCPGFKVDMNRLILMASDADAQSPPQASLIVTVGAVNLRSGSPNTSAPVVRTLPDGALLNVVRKVPGQAVVNSAGQSIGDWYQTLEGEYIWAGAVKEQPPITPPGA